MNKSIKYTLLISLTALLMAFAVVEKINIKHNWGAINLPKAMEVQSGYYKKVNDSVKMNTIGRTDLLVFQQKGLNSLETKSFGNYARVLINEEIHPKGLSSINNTKFTQEILDYIKRNQKEYRERQFKGTNTVITNFSDISILSINGEKCIHYSYTRNTKGNNPINCNRYMFHKKFKALIVSTEYDATEKEWKNILSNTVNTYKIRSSNN